MNICVTPHCNPSTKKRDTASRRIGVNERTDNRPTDRRTDDPKAQCLRHPIVVIDVNHGLVNLTSSVRHRWTFIGFSSCSSSIRTRTRAFIKSLTVMFSSRLRIVQINQLATSTNYWTATRVRELHSNTGISRSYHEAISLKKEVGYSCHLLGLRLNLHVPRSLKR